VRWLHAACEWAMFFVCVVRLEVAMSTALLLTSALAEPLPRPPLLPSLPPLPCPGHTGDTAHMTAPPRAQVGRGATRNEWWACPPRSGSITHESETVTGCWLCGLRPSEVVHETIPDPAEQAPLVARSVTPPSPSGRGGTTLLRQRAPRSCTVFVMTPPNEHTSEGGRDDRGVPYHAESALSSAQVLNIRCTWSTWSAVINRTSIQGLPIPEWFDST
jgi:hypothetical protein